MIIENYYYISSGYVMVLAKAELTEPAIAFSFI